MNTCKRDMLLNARRGKQADDKAYVHGNTAKLKRKIPPIIDAVIYHKGKGPLLPDFAYQHKNTTESVSV